MPNDQDNLFLYEALIDKIRSDYQQWRNMHDVALRQKDA